MELIKSVINLIAFLIALGRAVEGLETVTELLKGEAVSLISEEWSVYRSGTHSFIRRVANMALFDCEGPNASFNLPKVSLTNV